LYVLLGIENAKDIEVTRKSHAWRKRRYNTAINKATVLK